MASSQQPAEDIFCHMEGSTPDDIVLTMKACSADTDPSKVNLSAGVYADEHGKPVIFSAVIKAEELILNNPSRSKNYLPWTGLPSFNQTAQQIVFGEDSAALSDRRVATIQSLSGTGALSIGFALLGQFAPGTVYIPKPTWANHPGMIEHYRLPMREYPYWQDSKRDLDFPQMKEYLAGCPAGSIIILQATAHNPTGSDLTVEQWDALSDLFLERHLVAFFDLAYQGLASGDLDTDAYPLRLFADRGHNFLVAQSFSKSFGLYGERVGALHVICKDSNRAQVVNSQLEKIALMTYLNPPQHGALIVDTIWRNPELRAEYLAELRSVYERIRLTRKMLREALEKAGVPGDWSHITNQRGMFSFTGLTPAQCNILAKEFHIYMVPNGRANMAGINSTTVEKVARAIYEVVTRLSPQ